MKRRSRRLQQLFVAALLLGLLAPVSISLKAWLLAAMSLYLLWSGIRFHRGTDRDLWRYRSPTLPRALRHFDLVAPVTMALLFPAFVGMAVFLSIPFDPGPSHEVRGVGLIGAAYCLVAFAMSSVLLFQPPARLIPRWLVEDDERAGYVAPAPNLMDWLWLVVTAVPAAIIAMVAVAVGVKTYLYGP